ncbi:MAG TPA: serine protease [Vicinamibacterales bacterium]|jgi:S1-C subfamily serine protease
MNSNGLARLKLAAALIIAITASAGGLWYARHQPAPPPRKRIATAQPETNRVVPPATLVTPPTSDVLPPPEHAQEDTPAPNPAPDDLPQPSAMPLEDVIERVMPGVVRVETSTSRGSGFFVRSTLIVTNAHVPGDARTVTVTTQSGQHLPGRVLQSSEKYDVAVIQVGSSSQESVAVPLGQSAQLKLGQGIVALGWAEGPDQSTVRRGVITGLRTDGARQLLQTDTAPHPGDSGGPIVDRTGQVVGITTFRYKDGSAGLAVPIDDVKAFIQAASGMAPMATVATSTSSPTSPAVASPTDAPRASETDNGRQNGAAQFERDLASVAQRADRLDADWMQYRQSCGITSVPAGQTREWFGLYDPASPLHRAPQNCAPVLNDLQRQADGIGTLMRAADDLARRAGVFPGVRRDLRQRLRLDYSGWER